MIVSERVGCGWIVKPRSAAVAHISIASTPSAISSPGARADDTDAEDALSLRIDDQFRHAFRSVERDGAAGGAPWVLCDLVFAALLFGLRLGEAGPGDFRIGENDRGNSIGLEGDLVAGDRFGGGASLMGRFVRQHGFADNVADRENRWVVGLKLLVDLDESALVDFDLCIVRPGISEFGLRPTDIRTRSKTCSFSLTSAPSKVALIPFFSSFRDFHGRIHQDGAKHFSIRF